MLPHKIANVQIPEKINQRQEFYKSNAKEANFPLINNNANRPHTMQVYKNGYHRLGYPYTYLWH